MSTSRRALRIHLPENVDPTRAERDARSLRNDLRGLDGVDVAFADDLSSEPGAKGPGLSQFKPGWSVRRSARFG
jgi:hypothetical protein